MMKRLKSKEYESKKSRLRSDRRTDCTGGTGINPKSESEVATSATSYCSVVFSLWLIQMLQEDDL